MNIFKTLWNDLKESKSCGGTCEQGRLPCDCTGVCSEAKKTETLGFPPEKNSVYQNGNLEGNNH
jgi:hypothetical protein